MKQKHLEGKPLIVSASIGNDYSRVIRLLSHLMHKEAMQQIQRCFDSYAQDSDLPENGSLLPQFRILMNRLLKKYEPLFAKLAHKATARMVERVDKNAAATLKLSLREISPDLAVKTDFMSERLKEITQASVLESVSWIKTIPQQYLTQVQQAVTHSISTEGKGFAELKPQLEQLYKGNERKAELVALDQTRKVYRSIQAERMKKLGIKKFKWLHSGGGQVPRELHRQLNGKICSFEDPPFIGVMYGERIYGLPGQLPNCRCTMSPVFDFDNEEDE